MAGDKSSGRLPVSVSSLPAEKQPTANRSEDPPTISLHDAISKCLTKVTGQLLAGGVPVHSLDALGRPALHLAIIKSHVEMVELLKNFGADIEASSGPLAVKAIHLAAMILKP